MKAEDIVWQRMTDRAEARLSPGFADRVVREARSRRDEGGLLRPGQLWLSAATAAVALSLAVVLHEREFRRQSQTNLEGWLTFAAEAQMDFKQP